MDKTNELFKDAPERFCMKCGEKQMPYKITEHFDPETGKPYQMVWYECKSGNPAHHDECTVWRTPSKK